MSPTAASLGGPAGPLPPAGHCVVVCMHACMRSDDNRLHRSIHPSLHARTHAVSALQQQAGQRTRNACDPLLVHAARYDMTRTRTRLPSRAGYRATQAHVVAVAHKHKQTRRAVQVRYHIQLCKIKAFSSNFSDKYKFIHTETPSKLCYASLCLVAGRRLACFRLQAS